jgi:two-component system, probable response regulator PhcQ
MNPRPATATLLLVDDEPQVTDALKRALRRSPYEILTATSGLAALQLMSRQHVDVVVSDEQMPSMSGSEFLSLVRREHPHSIRMILSGHATLDAAVRAINDGEVYRFFLKPCNPTDLIFTIQRALEQQQLQERSRRLLREYQRQAATLAKLNHSGPDLLRLETDAQGAVVMDESDGEGDVNDLLEQMEIAMKGR